MRRSSDIGSTMLRRGRCIGQCGPKAILPERRWPLRCQAVFRPCRSDPSTAALRRKAGIPTPRSAPLISGRSKVDSRLAKSHQHQSIRAPEISTSRRQRGVSVTIISAAISGEPLVTTS